MSKALKELSSWWRQLTRSLWTNGVLASHVIPISLRWRLLRACGADIGRSRLYPGSFIGNLKRIHIGPDTAIHTGAFFDTSATITIGRSCGIANQVTMMTSSHTMGTPLRRAGTLMAQPITIGNGVWIGTRVTILPGVTVGDGCVLAAGAVVTKDCAPHGLYAGVPAKRVRELDLPAPTTD